MYIYVYVYVPIYIRTYICHNYNYSFVCILHKSKIRVYSDARVLLPTLFTESLVTICLIKCVHISYYQPWSMKSGQQQWNYWGGLRSSCLIPRNFSGSQQELLLLIPNLLKHLFAILEDNLMYLVHYTPRLLCSCLSLISRLIVEKYHEL